eukprot:CAMPEP_0202874548 /NCGR_PEP_ID=MMETSP1391-20130828/25604_1 /ASSEMBLY_ACC=CAM_ASM_000867 /TAXON_ID=1034604 /ORGANISM="Chlamydomonas leiostraca, Strain SAG 11-49" /LENGTH=255 /DNA_ID=CAMNT_0049556001 /DNA_START=218 /DNA_END=982 /DNA_ORIENTATION=+
MGQAHRAAPPLPATAPVGDFAACPPPDPGPSLAPAGCAALPTAAGTGDLAAAAAAGSLLAATPVGDLAGGLLAPAGGGDTATGRDALDGPAPVTAAGEPRTAPGTGAGLTPPAASALARGTTTGDAVLGLNPAGRARAAAGGAGVMGDAALLADGGSLCAGGDAAALALVAGAGAGAGGGGCRERHEAEAPTTGGAGLPAAGATAALVAAAAVDGPAPALPPCPCCPDELARSGTGTPGCLVRMCTPSEALETPT